MLHEFTMSVIADLYWPYLWFYPETPVISLFPVSKPNRVQEKKTTGSTKSVCL